MLTLDGCELDSESEDENAGTSGGHEDTLRGPSQPLEHIITCKRHPSSCPPSKHGVGAKSGEEFVPVSKVERGDFDKLMQREAKPDIKGEDASIGERGPDSDWRPNHTAKENLDPNWMKGGETGLHLQQPKGISPLVPRVDTWWGLSQVDNVPMENSGVECNSTSAGDSDGEETPTGAVAVETPQASDLSGIGAEDHTDLNQAISPHVPRVDTGWGLSEVSNVPVHRESPANRDCTRRDSEKEAGEELTGGGTETTPGGEHSELQKGRTESHITSALHSTTPHSIAQNNLNNDDVNKSQSSRERGYFIRRRRKTKYAAKIRSKIKKKNKKKEKQEKFCPFFESGGCRYGDGCRDIHDQSRVQAGPRSRSHGEVGFQRPPRQTLGTLGGIKEHPEQTQAIQAKPLPQISTPAASGAVRAQEVLSLDAAGKMYSKTGKQLMVKMQEIVNANLGSSAVMEEMKNALFPSKSVVW